MKIRKANKKDLSRLTRLSLEFHKLETRFDEDVVVNEQSRKELGRQVKEIFKSPDQMIFVAQKDEEIIGYVVARFSPGLCTSGRINEILVTKSERGKGIGTKLVERALSLLKKKGVKRVKLWVYKKNKKALTLYERLGFEKEPSKVFILGKEI